MLEVSAELISARPKQPLSVKTKFQGILASMQLDFLVLYNYIFPGVIYQPAFGFDFLGGFVEVVGMGEVPIPQTSRRDVARFLSYLLTQLPSTVYLNKRLVIEADRWWVSLRVRRAPSWLLTGSVSSTFNDAIDLYRDTQPDSKIFVQRISLEESEAKLA